MNFTKRNKSIMDFLFILALFGAFAITGLLVVLFGSKVYKSTVAKMDANYASRTALSYITEKVRAHDFTGGIEIQEGEGDDSVLLLKDKVNDKTYVTYMYVAEGMLKECTVSEDYDFNYDTGTDILKIHKFAVDETDDAMYKFDIVDEYDNETCFFVTMYSGTDGEQ